MLCKSYKPLSYHVIQALFDNPGDVQEAKRCVSLTASLQVLHDLVSHNLPLASFEVRFCFTKLQNIFKKQNSSIHTRQRASPGTKILQLLFYFLINTNEVITSNCVLNIHKTTSIKVQKQHLTCSFSLYAHSDHCIHCFPSVCALSVMRVTPRT